MAVSLATANAAAQARGPSLGGFIPFVGIGLTNESKTIDTLDLGAIPFIADGANAPGAPLLGAGGTPHFELALFDSGAATHILTQEAFAGFDIQGAGLRGTNTQIIGGATGQLVLEINDAAGIYATGLGDRTAAGPSLQLDTSTLRGQTSFATLTAPQEWTLPNIFGLPILAHHAVAIRNDQPQLFDFQGRTVRTPQIDFVDIGSGDQQGITRRSPLLLRPGIGFVQGPQYVFNFDLNDALGGSELDIANNPSSPSVIIDSNGNGGGLFIEVDLANSGRDLQDSEFFFDTGASLTVVSEQTAVRLGFDPILDTPEFVLQVEGSGGVSDDIPGFFLEELRLDTIGGGFVVENVPIAVLDVTNPNDPGNVLPGILGTNVFNGRNLVIDANPSVGQGGTGPSLYISDPVTETHVWTSPAEQVSFQNFNAWTDPGTPDSLWVAEVRNTRVDHQFVSLQGDATVFELVVAAPDGRRVDLQVGSGETLTTFGETKLEAGGNLVLIGGGRLDAAFVTIDGGVLRGDGEVFVGNGPINGAVRNLSGRIEVGLAGDGELAIEGDLSNLADGTIAFSLGSDTTPLLSVSRFAFLDGTLEVDLLGDADLMAGDQFTLITAGEGVSGEFETLLLPAGFDWDLQYLDNSVVLEVLGLSEALAGDFDGDSLVAASDYAVWRDGAAGANGYEVWRANFGQSGVATASAIAVPEPSAGVIVGIAAVTSIVRTRRRRAFDICQLS